jgi:acetyl-CoA synthetase
MAVNQRFYSLDRIRRMAMEAAENPARFWADKAEYLTWFEKPKSVLEGKAPGVYWFRGGLLNISYNAIDRHLPVLANKVAFYYENERGDSKVISYWDLYREVNRAAYVLRELGVKKGDTVSMMMPSIPEAVYFGLAVHRLGATLVIHYAGLSEETLAYRLQDCGSKVFVVASKGFRAGEEVRMKDLVDRTLEKYQTPIEKVLVVSRGFSDFNIKQGRDLVYEDIAPKGKVYIEPTPVEANEPGAIYYTSGTTGRPKGLMQSNGGYVIGLNWTFRALFSPRDDDVWWTISELGWPVWPMANLYTIPVMGLTGLLFEGFVGYRRDLFGRIIEKYGVSLIWSSTTTLYTIRSIGEDALKGDLSRLRIILNTGETLNPGVAQWYIEQLPNTMIADAYWMTEHLIPIAATPYGLGEIPYKLGSAGIQFPGSRWLVVDDDGNPLPPGQRGYIVISIPNPAMAKMWNDPGHERLIKTYWSRFPGYFYTGDYGFYDSDGYLYVLGRADDILSVGGERYGTMDIEGVLARHKAVAEAAVVGSPIQGGGGEKILAFVVLRSGVTPSEALINDIKEFARASGVRVDDVIIVRRLPKTKSGKIMRRLLRALVRNESYGDISTLDDVRTLDDIKAALKEKGYIT